MNGPHESQLPSEDIRCNSPSEEPDIVEECQFCFSPADIGCDCYRGDPEFDRDDDDESEEDESELSIHVPDM